MSILIKGMNIPSGCISCDFCNTFTDEPYCRRLMRKTPKVTRLKDCPLIEVPTTHGRLIDAEKLFKKGINLDWSLQKWVSEVDIGLMPTIIEAEEGENHE